MTIHEPQTVLALLNEDPQFRVYQYRHAQFGWTLYAAFPRGQHDDMAEAPDVREAVLLYDDGQWTEAGLAWYLAQEEEG